MLMSKHERKFGHALLTMAIAAASVLAGAIAATSPASTSPSCGPPMAKMMFTEVIRPRSASGVSVWVMMTADGVSR